MIEIRINFQEGVEVSVNGYQVIKTAQADRFTPEEVATLLERLDHNVSIDDAASGWNE